MPKAGDVVRFSDRVGWKGVYVLADYDYVHVNEDDSSGTWNYSYDRYTAKRLTDEGEWDSGGETHDFILDFRAIYGPSHSLPMQLKPTDLTIVGHMRERVVRDFYWEGEKPEQVQSGKE